MESPGSEESNISVNLNETLASSRATNIKYKNYFEKHSPKKLEQINLYININSIRSKCETLVTIVSNNIHDFVISETKIDSSFTTE